MTLPSSFSLNDLLYAFYGGNGTTTLNDGMWSQLKDAVDNGVTLQSIIADTTGTFTVVDQIIATSDVDGSATSVDLIRLKPGNTAGGIIPDDYESFATVSIEDLAGFIGEGTLRVAVVDAGKSYTLTAENLTSPWPEIVAPMVTRVSDGWIAKSIDNFYQVISSRESSYYTFSGVGLLALALNISDAVKTVEGILDRFTFWPWIGGQYFNPVTEGLTDPDNPPSEQPTDLHGIVAQPGWSVYVLDRGGWDIDGDTGVWTQRLETDVFRKGNGLRVVLKHAGVYNGATYMWLDDDVMQYQRGGGPINPDPEATGTWTKFFPFDYYD